LIGEYLAELRFVDGEGFEERREGWRERILALAQLLCPVSEVALFEERAVPLAGEMPAQRCLIIL
jgi:hypothetical protein